MIKAPMEHEVIGGDLVYRKPSLPMRNKLITNEKAEGESDRLCREALELIARVDAYLKELEGEKTT